MKITVTRKEEVEVMTMCVHAGVRYWSDATVNGIEGDEDGENEDPGIPLRDGDTWKIDIDIETGVIKDWPNGTTASVHYKVCDAGNYYLLDANGNVVASREDRYVPGSLCPKKSGHGDYIIMDIDGDGKIEGWDPDPSEFCASTEDE